MELKVIVVWKQRQVLRVQINAFFVGGYLSIIFFSFPLSLSYFLEYRHHTNPVGTSWQWKTDDAKTVCQGAIENHYKMINIFKGVPGVLPHRLAEGI